MEMDHIIRCFLKYLYIVFHVTRIDKQLNCFVLRTGRCIWEYEMARNMREKPNKNAKYDGFMNKFVTAARQTDIRFLFDKSRHCKDPFIVKAILFRRDLADL